ncbi:hypothetical protein ACO0SA_002499 [Hanseniaspora valbyensis]
MRYQKLIKLQKNTHLLFKKPYSSQINVNPVVVKQALLQNLNHKENLNNLEYLHSVLKHSHSLITKKIPDFNNLYLQKLFSIITPNNQNKSNEKCLMYLTEVLKIGNEILEKKDIGNLLSQIVLKQSDSFDEVSDNSFLKDIIDYMLILSGHLSNIHPQVVYAILKYLNTLPVNEENLQFSNKIILPIIEDQLYLKTPSYTSILIDILTKQKRLNRIQELLPIISDHLSNKEQLHLKLFEIFVSLKDEANLKELMIILDPTVTKYPQVMSYIIKSSDDPILKLNDLQPELQNNINIIQYLIFSNDLLIDLLNNYKSVSVEYLKEYMKLLNLQLRLNLDENMFDNDYEKSLYSNWKSNVGELMVILFLKQKKLSSCIDFLYENTDLKGLVTFTNTKKILKMLEKDMNKCDNFILKKKFTTVKNVLRKRLNGETLVNRNHNRSFLIQDY